MHSRHTLRTSNESGIAMITTLLVLMLMTALLVGFTTVVMSDQRYRFIDRDRGQAFYAASAGVEKLTADLGNLFLENVAPTGVQVQALTDPVKMPVINGVTFVAAQAAGALPASQLTDYHCIGRDPVTNLPTNTKTANQPVGTNGYMIRFCKQIATGNPTISDDNLVVSGTGAYAGMTALQTPYQLDITAKTAAGGEVHLSRTIQAVAIPVFQFGMFSDPDLSFFAGATFGFGGRIHTNGNLFLAQGGGAGTTLTLTGRVTAFKDVIRQVLANGASIDTQPWTQPVSLATSAAAPTGNRILARTEGSLVAGPGSSPWTGWNTLSLGAGPINGYNGFLRNGPTGTGATFQPGTGSKQLRLPLTASGVTGCFQAGVSAPCTNIEVVKRPLQGEDVAGILYNERLFTKASIRVLLSDTAANITNIPGIDNAVAPVSLETNWNLAANLPAGYGPVSSTRPPPALSVGARRGVVTGTSGGGPYTISFSTADAANFKPKFALCNPGACAVAPATPYSCDVKTNTGFSGCLPNTMPIILGSVITMVSPAGAPWGLTGVTSPASLSGTTTSVTFAAGGTANFNPLPFWDTSTTPPRLIQCTGTYTATTFQGCSAAPPNGAVMVSGALTDPGISTLGGFIKIERQNAADNSWHDITVEMLNYGIGDANDSGLTGTQCADPTPNAIIRLQRLRDNLASGGGCNYNTDPTGAKDPTNWWPYAMYDAREGLLRDWDYPNPGGALPPTGVTDGSDPRYLTLGGVMYYVNIDAGNLTKWFAHNTAPFNVAASTGNLAKPDITGFSVYFSDRRNNRNQANQETGEYGWEDFVNPTVANGVAANGLTNGAFDNGEDVNESGTQELYGGVPNYNGAYNLVPPCGACAVVYNGTTVTALWTAANVAPQKVISGLAQMNRPILFRRALMLTNGRDIATGVNGIAADKIAGLTIVSENPVYIKGDWNADSPAGVGFGGVNAASSVIADSVTLLSSPRPANCPAAPAQCGWSDSNSFANPYNRANRVANVGSAPAVTAGWYRLAIIAGKGRNFPLPTVGQGMGNDFGTDGGAHNFLRFLEDWSNGGQTVNYLGSLATLYYNRQGVGTYKCCTTVYNAPTRAYNFDVNFLNPALLPPLTPMFRDVNVIGFSQELRPGR